MIPELRATTRSILRKDSLRSTERQVAMAGSCPTGYVYSQTLSSTDDQQRLASSSLTDADYCMASI
jgi:hypothetical protein